MVRLAFVCVLALLAGCGGAADDAVTPEEARTIAREAYVYGFPMVMNFKTLTNYVLDEQSPEYKGPFNQVACEARLFTPADRAGDGRRVMTERGRTLMRASLLVLVTAALAAALTLQ